MADRALTYEVKLNLSQAKAEAVQLEALFKSELSKIQIIDPLQVQQQFAPLNAQIQATTDRYAKFQTASRAAADAANAASQQSAQGANAAQNQQTSVTRSESQLRIIAARAESQERIILARQAATAAAEAEKRTTATVKAELAQQAAAARQAAQASATTPAGNVGRGGGGLGGLLGGAIAGYLTIQGARQLVQGAVELDRLGTTAKRAAIGFNILSGGADKAAKNLKAIEDAGGGAIDQLTAMTVGMQLSALNLAKTSDEFGKLTRAAREVSLVSPVIHDVQGAISELSLAAANLSFRRLDQLGLTVDDVKSRMAELQAANSGLSDSDAFLAASVDALETKYGKLLNTTEAQVSGAERLAVAWSNAKLALATGPVGGGIDATAGALAAGVSDVTTTIGDLPTIWRAAMGDMEAQATIAAQQIKEKLGSIGREGNSFWGTQPGISRDDTAQITALQNLQTAFTNVNAAVAAGVPGAQEYRDRLVELSGAILDNNDASGESASGLRVVSEWYGIVARGAVETITAVDGVTAAVQQTTADQRAAFEDLQGAITTYNEAVAAGAPNVQEYGDKVLGAVDALLRLTDANYDSTSALSASNSWMGVAADGAFSLASALDTATVSQLLLNQAMAHTPRNPTAAVSAAAGAFGGQRTQSQVSGGQYDFDWRNQRAKDKRDFDEKQAREADKLQREIEAAQRKSGSAAKSAAKSAEKASQQIQASLESIPGLFKESEVTAKQLEDARAGKPQNFADDWLRRLKDEVLNGKDWEGVSIEEAAKRAGIDPNLPAEQILKQFSEAWNNSSLFADKNNLELINQEFVNAQVTAKAELEEKIKQGQQNIFELFGVAADTATQAAAAVASGAGASFGGGGGRAGVAAGSIGALDASIIPTLDTDGIQAQLDPLALTVTPRVDLGDIVTANFDALNAAKISLSNALTTKPKLDFSTIITDNFTGINTTKTSLSEALKFKAMVDFSTFIADSSTGIGVAKGLLGGAMKFPATPDFSQLITANFDALSAAKTSLSNFMAFSVTPSIDVAGIPPFDLGIATGVLGELMKFSPKLDLANIVTNSFDAIQLAKSNLSAAISIAPAIDVAAFSAQFTGDKAVDLAGPFMDAMEAQLAMPDNDLRLLTAGDSMAATVGFGFAGHEWGTLITPMIATLTGSISSELNYAKLYGGGKQIADIILGGFRDQSTTSEYVADFVNSVMAQILNQVADAVSK